MRKVSEVIGEALTLYTDSSQFLCYTIRDHFPKGEAELAQRAILDQLGGRISLTAHLLDVDPIFASIYEDEEIPHEEKRLAMLLIKRAWFKNLIAQLEIAELENHPLQI